MKDDLLKQLKEASSDEEREWLVLQFELDNLDSPAREAIWAAAVPHWFDEAFLAALLEKSVEDVRTVYQKMIALSFVEPFPERGHNVHERTRNLLLGRLWKKDRDRYRKFSQKAADYCDRMDTNDTLWQVEAIYHLMVADPVAGADRIRSTGFKWHDPPFFAYDKVEVMAQAAREHANAMRLTKRGLGWTLFWEALLDSDFSRYQTSKEKYLQIQITPNQDPYLAASYSSRLGAVHFLLNEHDEARQRYEEAMQIFLDIGARWSEMGCILGLADLDCHINEWATAELKYQQALAYYQSVGDRLNSILALRGLAKSAQNAGNLVQARNFYQSGLELAIKIESSLVMDIQTSLDSLQSQPDEHSE